LGKAATAARTRATTTFADATGVIDGVIAYIPRATLESKQLMAASRRLGSFAKKLPFLAAAMGAADSIYLGIKTGSIETGLKRAGRNTSVFVGGAVTGLATEAGITFASGGTTSLPGITASFLAGTFVAGKIDQAFERIGW
jgi:hypothetical protein